MSVRTTPQSGRTDMPSASGPADTPASNDRLIALGVVTSPQGLQGEVRLKPFTDDPASLKRFREVRLGGRPMTLKGVRVQPNGVIVRFAEVTDRTQAEALRGLELAVPRTALPVLDDGEVYHADLIGLAVTTPDGQPAGQVVAVTNYGAGDILEIERTDGRIVLVPFRPFAVPDVDVAGRRLTVEPDFLSEGA